MEKKRIYLACPYSSPSKTTRLIRVEMATRACARLFEQGHLPYSPITHGHELCKRSEITGDFETHKAHCLSFLEHWATDFYCLTLDGWNISKGVLAEAEFAKARGIPITKISLEDLGIKKQA